MVIRGQEAVGTRLAQERLTMMSTPDAPPPSPRPEATVGLAHPLDLGAYRVLQSEPAMWSACVIVERDVQHWFLFTSTGKCESDGQPYASFHQPGMTSPSVPMSFVFIGTKSPLDTRRKLEKEGISFNHIVANLSRKPAHRARK